MVPWARSSQRMQPPSNPVRFTEVAKTGFRIQNLVGGPGFEPGASRSRITRRFIQTCRFLRSSVRFFKSTRPERPDLHESSAGLLHELLHGLSTEVDGATLRCAPASGGATCVHCGRSI